MTVESRHLQLAMRLLYAAAERGDKGKVKSLLDSGSDASPRDSLFDNPLQAASHDRHVEVAQLLLEHGADVNAQVGVRAPLFRLLLTKVSRRWFSYCWREVLMSMHKAAAIPMLSTLLPFVAARRLCSYLVLLQGSADVGTEGGHYGMLSRQPLSRATERWYSCCWKKGADVNAQGGHYGNALQAGCDGENEHIVQLLLEEDANVNAQCGYYGTALEAACQTGCQTVIQLLLEKERRWTTLIDRGDDPRSLDGFLVGLFCWTLSPKSLINLSMGKVSLSIASLLLLEYYVSDHVLRSQPFLRTESRAMRALRSG